MKREIYDRLLKWKNDPGRKPLIIYGARQVGKTYVVREFGNKEFEDMIVLNCDKDERIAGIFESGFRTERILSDLEIITGRKIVPGKTLIFLDEIQEVPRAISALKYFCEDAPQYHIVAAGSLLGLAIHEGASFPVGKVDEMTLYPLSFPEFIMERLGEDAYKRLKSSPLEELAGLSQTFTEALKEYYFTGGMPEIVQAFFDGHPPQAVRDMQKRILADYVLDISKHAKPEILGRIHQVWNSIPQQLAKCNKKFIYGDIQKGARAKDFEPALEWLIDAGLVYKVSRVRKAGIPLEFYEDFSAFKLFLIDHGLMGAMTDAPISEILIGSKVFEEYKGTFTEQYVLEQLRCYVRGDIFFFNSESTKLELDFLIQDDSVLVPVEVKAEENLRSKSLSQFYKDNENTRPVRLSMSPYRKQDWMTNIPLYAACRVVS